MRLIVDEKPEGMFFMHCNAIENMEGTDTLNEKGSVKENIPLISVVIPVFNAENYIERCLESVTHSTLKNIEIICVDDGSTDNSLGILQNYSKKDGRIQVLTQENLHAGVARNAGIEAAKGKYIHFLDADDFIDYAAYEKWYQIAEENNSDVCVCQYNTINKQTGEMLRINKNRKYKDSYLNTTNIKKDADYLIFNEVAPWNKIYLRSFLLRNNIRFDDLVCANDRSFYFAVIYKAERITTVNEHWIYYTINNEKSLVGNTRLKNFDVHFKSFMIIWNVLKDADDEIKKKVLKNCITDSFYFYRKSIGTGYQKSIENQMYDFWHKKYIPLLGEGVLNVGWFKDYLKILLRDMPQERSSEILTIFDMYRNRQKTLEIKNKKMAAKNKRIEAKYNKLLNSRSYKIGRIITLPVRTVKSIMKTLK